MRLCVFFSFQFSRQYFEGFVVNLFDKICEFMRKPFWMFSQDWKRKLKYKMQWIY